MDIFRPLRICVENAEQALLHCVMIISLAFLLHCLPATCDLQLLGAHVTGTISTHHVCKWYHSTV